MSISVGLERPALEVADVIREHGEAFLSRHGGWLSGTQKKALRDLARCRTAALGAHVQVLGRGVEVTVAQQHLHAQHIDPRFTSGRPSVTLYRNRKAHTAWLNWLQDTCRASKYC